MKCLVLIAAIVGLGLLGPARANADIDSEGFLNWLSSHGEDTSTAEIRFRSVDLGMAICNLYATSGSNDEVNRTVVRDQGPQSAAVWTVGSVLYLCPQYRYLLPS
jgi:hypothetical protein